MLNTFKQKVTGHLPLSIFNWILWKKATCTALNEDNVSFCPLFCYKVLLLFYLYYIHDFLINKTRLLTFNEVRVEKKTDQNKNIFTNTISLLNPGEDQRSVSLYQREHNFMDFFTSLLVMIFKRRQRKIISKVVKFITKQPAL